MDTLHALNFPDHDADAVERYPEAKARTVRFGCGAPRSPRLLGDGERMLFLRSDAGDDVQTSLWMSSPEGEVRLADPRDLLADADGAEVPVEERARRERARESGSGIVGYCVDAAGRRAAFTLGGGLYVADLATRRVRRLELSFAEGEAWASSPILNARLSPDGSRVAYATGEAVVVADADSGEASVVFEVPRGGTVHAGIAEFAAAEELDRYDGFWWSPDGSALLVERYDEADEPLWTISDPADPAAAGVRRRYPRALTHNARVELVAVRLGDDRLHAVATARVEWDGDAFEYLATVCWQDGRAPLLLVLDRLQTDSRVLRVDLPADGSWSAPVTVLSEAHDDCWLDVIGGVPAYTPDGRLLTFVNDLDADTNRLALDGVAFTPVGWQVRDVLDVDGHGVLCVAQRTPALAGASPADADGHDARSHDVVQIGYDGSLRLVTREAGVWNARRAGRGMVVWGRTMDDARLRMEHHYDGRCVEIRNDAAVPGLAMDVHFARLGERGLHAAIVAPTDPALRGRTLPVLMHPYGGPGFQEVTMAQSAYWDAQWWAEQGYLVVVADGRGTTGRGPRWDREMHLRMKDVSLEDQVGAVRALPDAIAALRGEGVELPEPDLERVAMIGWSYGGFLSAAAVLDAPDVFAAACAGAPPTDWTLYDTCYTERYLDLDPAVYEANGILGDAAGLRRPLMLIHGFADDNVTVAHSLRLSSALMAVGKSHTFLPLSGITHMTNDPVVARNLLMLQRDFLASALTR
ncbi:prolyl oligopeptidase family serine peptidase [Bifidobacterium cuniculi]|uniref:Dipeptidylaminopeptidase/acylaminoacyl-peptidase n=1 Tax=Bifidobacterium cuniculi TaxID=1688 RepID=A0A087ATF1_9BIFI|nr:prolyl oligopeptidase family serine peptidase [Bifidobacterium cuniculi]KFI62051.1 Dipeptidylaminopeptidase/acylaminoacyl-peptidase [Bifidobacterium cuniculi]